MFKILVIEDDKDISELLKFFLEDNGYSVRIADNGIEGIEIYRHESIDLILLDILLPKVDGYMVCKTIRKESDIPVIMITALTSEDEQIRGYDLQVDDYVTKPFSMPVLLKKVAAVLRRINGDQEKNILFYKDLVLDTDNYRVSIKERTIDLTKKEFEILRELLMNQNKILTRELLLGRVWKYEYFGNDRIVDNHIKNIRKKLGVDYIETIKGVGYRIDKVN
ncbi:response regulator transcription factor [Lacrimispora xylanisolvens]|uniref:response regulator transcription factor n=1 Tax=Lacrimispora xylanisolvens TaxID=384636 RepID=UPI00240285FE